MALAPLPARISSAQLELPGLARETGKFAVDTINHLKSLQVDLQAQLDALGVRIDTLDASDLPTAAPPIGIGAGNLEGIALSLSRSDHNHTLRETSGPTNLTLGSILDDDLLWRVGSIIRSRQIICKRSTASQSTTSTTLSDVGSNQTIALKADVGYALFWICSISTAATTTGCQLSVNYTGTASAMRFGIIGATGLTALQSEQSSTFDTKLGQAGVGPGGTARTTVMFAFIRTTTAGGAALRFATGVAGSSVTVGTNSFVLAVEAA